MVSNSQTIPWAERVTSFERNDSEWDESLTVTWNATTTTWDAVSVGTDTTWYERVPIVA